MKIHATAKQRKPPAIQRVSGKFHDLKFSQSAPWVVMDQAHFERVDFSGQKFDPLAVGSASFVECDFGNAKLVHASLGSIVPGDAQSFYRDCRFDGANMRALPHIGNARFQRCSFRGAKIEGWRADKAEFVDCVFSGRMYDCRFAGRPWDDDMGVTRRSRNEFRGNDFREAQLEAVMFVYGIDLRAQTMPEGERYLRLDRPSERIDLVRRQVALWSDDSAREYALSILRDYSDQGCAEQAELWVDRNLFSGGRWPGVGDRVWDMMESSLA